MNQTRIINFLILCGLACTFVIACGGSGNDPDENGADVVRSDSRPNIIFVFTDDQGFADIGAQGVVDDIKTPHIDALAANGVRMQSAYVTAPQCTPSRGALMSGRQQQSFGLDDNAYTPFPLSQRMLPEALRDAGYRTGMVGKWHLEIDANSKNWFYQEYAPGSSESFDPGAIPMEEKLRYFPHNRGFEDVYFGYINNYFTNFSLKGKTLEAAYRSNKDFRVDVVSDAAVAFIRRHKTDPFFLYVAYFAPHVPLEATDKYLSRFPGDMPERRRYALAMMAAMDDGVGRIVSTLESYGLDDDTIIFFMSDNGAPLALTKDDVMPVSEGGAIWDGSLNDPWIGEKGMLSEGAIRVPYIVSWKDHLLAGKVIDQPVSTLDASATAASLAGLELDGFDGIDLMPYLQTDTELPERALYWRFLRQSAIRKGDWKYLRLAEEREFLFDLSSDQHESINLIEQYPEIANELKSGLVGWAENLYRPGLSTGMASATEQDWYQFYFPTP